MASEYHQAAHAKYVREGPVSRQARATTENDSCSERLIVYRYEGVTVFFGENLRVGLVNARRPRGSLQTTLSAELHSSLRQATQHPAG